MAKIWKFCFLIMICATIFSSCSSTGSAVKAGSSGINIPPSTAKPPILPLDSSQDVDSTALIQYADASLIKNCMARKGFPYPMLSLSQDELEDSATMGEPTIILANLGVDTLSEAQLSGYSSNWIKYKHSIFNVLKIVFGSHSPEKIVQGYKNKYGPSYEAALGIPGSKRGCANNPPGGSTIMHLAVEYNNLNASLRGASGTFGVTSLTAQTLRNPLVVKAMKKWSACMASQGYDLKTPPSATGSRAPTRSQIAMAVTDYNCKEKANLINTWLAVYAYYQNQILNLYPTQFQKMEQLTSQIATAAQKVISCVKA